VLAYTAAVILPIGIAVASIPLRSNHGPTIAVVLLACVVIIAALSATGPAITAAATAAAAYDFFLTQPH
jgi:K+-sensing histidine kinase KdpD